MDFDFLPWIVAGVAVVVAAISFVRKGTNPIEAFSQYELILKTTREFVQDAQDAYETGQIERNERFAWVLARLRDVYPGLSENVLAGTIESAVAWLKLLQTQQRPEAEDTSYVVGHRGMTRQ